MDDYEPIIRKIAKRTKTEFRPASAESIRQLRDLRFPESVVALYAGHEPATEAESPEGLRLKPIADVVIENTRGVPGICVAPHGYRVFATTMCGDTYCLNLNRLDAAGRPEIVLISHEAVGRDSPAADVHRVAKTVARNVLDFLGQFHKGTVDEDAIE